VANEQGALPQAAVPGLPQHQAAEKPGCGCRRPPQGPCKSNTGMVIFDGKHGGLYSRAIKGFN